MTMHSLCHFYLFNKNNSLSLDRNNKQRKCGKNCRGGKGANRPLELLIFNATNTHQKKQSFF